MGDFSVHVKVDNTPQAKAEMKKKIRVALNAAGIQAASAAREEIQKSPKRIDTGLLRNSITYAMDGESAAIGSYKADRASQYTGKIPEPGTYTGKAEKEPEGKDAVYVGTNVDYAIYVHEGTDRMAANRFIKNAVENNSAELIEIIKSHLQGD